MRPPPLWMTLVWIGSTATWGFGMSPLVPSKVHRHLCILLPVLRGVVVVFLQLGSTQLRGYNVSLANTASSVELTYTWCNAITLLAIVILI